MRSFSILVLTPAGAASPALAIAACRAGARGTLDLEHTHNPAVALTALRRLEQFTTSGFGIKIGRQAGALLPQLLAEIPSRLHWVVLAGGSHPDLETFLILSRHHHLEVLIEAASLDEALSAERLGVDGLILKGNESGGRVGPDSAFMLLQQWQNHKDKETRRQGDKETQTESVIQSPCLPVSLSPCLLPVWVQGGIGLNTAAACAAAGAAGVVLEAQLLLTREASVSPSVRRQLATFDGSETLYLGERLGQGYRFFSRPGLPAVEAVSRIEQQLAEASASEQERCQQWREAAELRGAADPDSGLWFIGPDAAFAKPLAARYATVGGIVRALTERVQVQLQTARQSAPLAEGSPLAVRHRTRYPIVQGPMTRVSDTAAFAQAVAEAGALPFLALALMRRPETEKLLQETRARLGDRSWGAGILGFAPPDIRRDQIEAIRAARPPFALIAGGRPDQARQLETEGIPTYLHVPSPGLLKMFLRDGARRFIFEGRECGGHVGPRSSFVLWETMCEVLLDHIGPTGRGDDLNILFAGGIHDALSAAMVAALGASLAERGVAIGVLMGTAYLFTTEAVASGAIVPQYQQEALTCRQTVLLETGPGHAIRCVNTPYFDIFEREKRRLQSEGRSHDEVREALESMNIGRLRIASKGIDRAVGSGQWAAGSGQWAAGSGQQAAGSGKMTVDSGKAGAPPTVGNGQGAGASEDSSNASSSSLPTAHCPLPTAFVSLSAQEQRSQGMYMIGQVAGLRDRIISMAQLHEEVSLGSTQRLQAIRPDLVDEPPTHRPSDIAIVGMACLFPKAPGLRAYWENILNRVDAITEVPLDHWDWRLYYDPNPKARDKISSKWGGFLDDMPFDPLVYGMPPNSLTSIEPIHLFLLETVRKALANAGYADRPFDRSRTSVILGAGGGAAQLAMAYGFRSYLPLLETVPGSTVNAAEILKQCDGVLPEWTEDSFPGILLNVAAGRVANRFNFGGANFSIDAACGSSLAALHAGVRELEMGTSDTVVLMGADSVQNPFTYLLFSKTHAFSPRGRCSTFDEAADGIVISEGVAVVILKRLADAERDGDRIYAVIKGVGASSDGRDKGLTAPRPEGQLRALRRAYAKAGLSPAQVELVEAHGTGTVVGDQTEVQSLGQVMCEAGAPLRSCAVGSVKSMIGHTKCAAGLAGLINATLSLYHKTLPPLLVQQPNSKANFEQSPLFLNTEARPWIHGRASNDSQPRCAGVSAFGFGGTNFHAVLQEYTGDYLNEPPPALRHWPAELLVWRKPSRAALLEALETCQQALEQGAKPELADLAYSLWLAVGQTFLSASDPADRNVCPTSCCLAIVAASLDDLKEKLKQTRALLAQPSETIHDPRGIFFAAAPAPGKIAFLFPGQGSQYPNMLAQLALVFPEVRKAYDDAESTLAGRLDRPLGKLVFPPSAFTPDQEQEARKALTRTDVAQPAIGAASLGMFHLLTSLGIEPDFLAGHSYGDYVALCAAGALSEPDLIRLSHQRGRAIIDAAEGQAGSLGGMAAIEAGVDLVQLVLAGLDGVTAANLNAPSQTVISGTTEAIDEALARFQKQGIRGQRIPVGCGFHSPAVAAARQPFAQALLACSFAPPRRPVYANTTAAPYPQEPAAIIALLADHLTSPVRFQEEIEALYAAGARTFVEVGPQSVLTGLTGQVLAGRSFLAAASDLKGRPGLVQLAHLLGQLFVSGVRVRLDRLFQDRDCRALDLAHLEKETTAPKLAASTWLVNSARVRPIHAPEPVVLGQARSASSPRTIDPSKPIDKAPAQPAAPAASRAQRPVPPVRDPASSVPPTVVPMPTFSQSRIDGPPPLPAGAAGDEAAQAMSRFQDLMARFLETQRLVMLSYLQGNGAVPPVASLPINLPVPPPAPSLNGHAAQPLPPAPAEPDPVVAAAPAPPPPPAAPVTPAARPSGGDREALTTRLLDIVRQRTGYPPEMLGLDLDLEADLGIDSIKRVEILGSLTEANGAGAISAEMEKLTSIKTLRGILDCLAGAEAAPDRNGSAHAYNDSDGEESSAAGSTRRHRGDTASDRAGIQRMRVVPVDAPLPPEPTLVLPSGTLIVTDDGRGIALALAARLREQGQSVVLVRPASGPAPAPAPGSFQADLTDPRAVEELLQRLRQQFGPIAGLIHLLPLAEPPARESWSERVRREVKSLFLLARGLADELCRFAGTGNALLLAATAVGEPGSDFSPGSGGVGGIVKSLAHEWPGVFVRVVDLDRAEATVDQAERLLAELSDPDSPIEIAYRGSQRTTPQCQPAPLDVGLPATLALGPEATLLLTGGARGITAAVALQLARRYQPTLVLVGRSALPEAEEPAETAALTAPADLKAALIARLRREGSSVSPAAVEAAYHRLLQDREIRTNLAQLRQAGSRVHYYQADVRDEPTFATVIDEVYRRFGKLDGVIHGAGVIQDKLIRDKTPESFDRVFGTKVDSALILSRHLRPEQLQFCVFFASVAGRFGNRGQSDYAAANEVLTRLAADLDRRWPGRVVSMAWGPWSSIGMVADLEQHLGQRGLQMIPPAIGPLFLDEELSHGRKGESEVVIAGDVGQLALRPVAHAAGPRQLAATTGVLP